jgi:predicted phosphodiesterase
VRVAVLSDIHANLVALDAVLADAGRVDAVWHLGDVVGYGPQPDAVVQRLIEVGAVGVTGNHDRAAAGGDEIDWFNPDARAAMEWTKARISSATADWLRTLPERRTERGVSLVHGSPRDPIWEYILSPSDAKANLAELTTRVGLFGHTHLPVQWTSTDGRVRGFEPVRTSSASFADAARALVNPGSVGQPRDGDRRASWLELELDAGTARWHRVDYDIAAVQSEMRAAGLPIRLAERLAHGL